MKYDIDSIKKRKIINNRIKKIVFIFIIIMLYNITLLYISYIDKFETPSFYVYEAYMIDTTSMEPTLNKNDVIIIKKCKEENLKKGDIITYKINGEIITHRIVEIVQEEITGTNQYITKGDNNNVEDEDYILFSEIEGKMIIKIPGLGNVVDILKNGIVIILVILIFLIIYLNRVEMKEKSEARREKKRIEDKKFMGE
jgi:signal peptidase I